MSEWQPIETAPRDGTTVLVIDPYGDCSIAAWDGQAWAAFADGTRALRSQGDTWTDYIEPTPSHWMPLPEPPAEKQP